MESYLHIHLSTEDLGNERHEMIRIFLRGACQASVAERHPNSHHLTYSQDMALNEIPVHLSGGGLGTCSACQGIRRRSLGKEPTACRKKSPMVQAFDDRVAGAPLAISPKFLFPHCCQPLSVDRPIALRPFS